MFAGDDDDQSIHSFDLSSVRHAQPSQPHWSHRYTNGGGGHARTTSAQSGSTVNGHAYHGNTRMEELASRDDEDEFGWSGSAGGIRGRDDRQLERDKEFERQIEERRRRRKARKEARDRGLPDPFTDQPPPSLAADPSDPAGVGVNGKKAYRPVFAPTESDLRKATTSSGGTPPPDEGRRKKPAFVATRALAESGPEAQLADQVSPPASPQQATAPRRGVTLTDDGVVPALPKDSEVPAVKVSRSKSLKNLVKRPGILRAQSEGPRQPKATTPTGAEEGRHYDFLSTPPANRATFAPDTNGEAPAGGAGLKRGMSLKDKVGAALGRFGSRRDRGHAPSASLSASVPASASAVNGRSGAGLSRNATTGGVGMRKSGSAGRPRATTTGTIRENGSEGGGEQERGMGGLVRRMSRKLSEDADRAAERRRREQIFFEPPKLSHVLVGAASPFPPRPPLGTTGVDSPPSFNRVQQHMGSRPPAAPTRARGSSYARTPYEEKKEIAV